jgi:hypothetical protein
MHLLWPGLRTSVPPQQTKPAKFRARAGECEREAKRASDPKLKAQFEDLATRWRRLAEEAERLDERREK